MPSRTAPLLPLLLPVAPLLLLALPLGGCRSGPSGAALDDRLRPVSAEPKFEDLKDDPIRETAEGLARLGVLESGGGHFLPDQPVRRGDFVTWLVRANDIYFRDQPRRQIPLAKPGDLPLYEDVSSTVACFPYLQGMVNAGYVVGFSRREFAYDRNLTREHLILLRDSIDLGTDKVLADPAGYDALRVRLRALLKDADQVSDPFLAAVLADLTEGETMRLAFASTDRLEPQRYATRRESALALAKLRGRTYQEALTIEPKWEPLPPEEQPPAAEETGEAAPEHEGHSH